MDDNVVDSLRIEITGDSGKAADSIEKLISTLERLKTTTSGASNVTKTLESSFQKAMSGSASALKSISSKTGELKNAVSGVTEQYRLITNEIDKTNAKLDALYDRENKMRALGESEYSKSWKSLQYDIEQAEQKLAYFKEKQEQMRNDGSAFVQTPNINVEQFIKARSEADLLNMKLKETKNKLQELLDSGNTDSSAVASLVSQIKGLEDKLSKATHKGKALKAVLNGIGTSAKSVGAFFGKTALFPIKKFGDAVKGAAGKVGGLFQMFKKRAIYRSVNAVLSAITSGFKEGTANVYQYSKALGGTLASSLDHIATSFLYLKNSIGAMVSPLINMAAPAIDYVIDKFVDLLNTANQVFAKLSGASTWTKAVKYPTEYAEAADAATAANKELKKSILGIDELNTLTDNSASGNGGSESGMDYSKMFEEVELGEINNPFKDFFKPFANAWKNEGQNTINSIKNAFTGVKGFISSVGESFRKVWENGTGQQTVETVLRIFQNLLNCVGNLGSSLKTAWEANDNGTRILQNIWNIFNDILGFVERIFKATAKWLKSIDLTPFMKAFEGCTAALEPLVDLIGNTLSWLYETVLLPIASWAFEEAAPASINAITAALRMLQALLQPFLAGVKQLWSALQPVVEWVESVVIEVIGWVKSLFEKLADTFWEKGEKIQNIISGIGVVINAVWLILEPTFTEFKDLVGNVFGFFADLICTTIEGAIDFLSGLIDFVVGIFTGDWSRAWDGIMGMFVANWDYIKNIGQNVVDFLVGAWNSIKSAFSTVGDWMYKYVVQPVGSFFSNMWDGFLNGAKAAWDGIKSVFSGIADWFKNIFSAAWQAVKNVFSAGGKVFDGIKDGIVTAFKTVVNAIITGINKVVAVPFNAINGILKSIHDVNILGVTPFSWIKTFSVPQIPLLADGGMVNAGTAFIAGEAGAEVVANIGKRTGVMNVDQMRESVEQGVIDANAEQNALLREEISILRKLLDKDTNVTAYVGTGNLISGLERKNRRDGKTVVPVGL